MEKKRVGGKEIRIHLSLMRALSESFYLHAEAEVSRLQLPNPSVEQLQLDFQRNVKFLYSVRRYMQAHRQTKIVQAHHSPSWESS